MSSKKRDLVIHYDEENQKIIFYSTDTANTERIRTTEFDGVCPAVSFFKEKSPSEAEGNLGGMVFSLLDLHSNTKIGIRDYAVEAEQAVREYVQDFENEAREGDVEACYNLFIHLHGSAIRNRSLTDLERAERMLATAVQKNYPDAMETLKQWPDIKAAAERHIQRGKLA